MLPGKAKIASSNHENPFSSGGRSPPKTPQQGVAPAPWTPANFQSFSLPAIPSSDQYNVIVLHN
jgi:hypothetical protein